MVPPAVVVVLATLPVTEDAALVDVTGGQYCRQDESHVDLPGLSGLNM